MSTDLLERDEPTAAAPGTHRARRASRGVGAARSLVARIGAAPLISLVATLALAGSAPPAFPAPGLDPGYRAGISIAIARRWQFGPDIMFTYGPWGFLSFPLAEYRVQFLLGLGFSLASLTLLWTALFIAIRRMASGTAAAIGAAVLTIVVSEHTSPGVHLIAAVGCFLILWLTSRRSRGTLWFVAAISVAAALLIQVKFSEGAVLAVLAAISAVTTVPPRQVPRMIGVMLIGFVASFLLFWTVAGQSPGNIAQWLAGSMSLTTGFADAMAAEATPNVATYLVAAVIVGVSGASAFRAGRDVSVPARLGVNAVTVVVLYFGVRQGFTRHDDAHDTTFFMLAAGMLIVLARHRTRVVALTLAAVAAVFAGQSWAPFDLYRARDAWESTLQIAVDRDYHRGLHAEAAADARSAYDLSPLIDASIGDRPVSVDPWESNLPWAYSMNWNPLPVFQNYTAYTPLLDRTNADAVIRAPGDQVVLRSAGESIDKRNPLWETPRYQLALACNYRSGTSDGEWLVLSHSVDRCSAPVRVGELDVEAGQVVVPPTVSTDEIVVARFVPDGPGFVEAVATTLFKPFTPLWIDADGERFRVPRGLSDGPLLVRVPHPVGWPARFGGETSYSELRFSEPGHVVFEAVPVKRPGDAGDR